MAIDNGCEKSHIQRSGKYAITGMLLVVGDESLIIIH